MPERILCVHQGFPAQFAPVVKALLQRGCRVDALHHQGCDWSHPNLYLHRWRPLRGTTPGLIDGVAEVESKFIRAAAVAEQAQKLAASGYTPELILAHPGWGESLYLSSIWPQVPQLHYLEYYYQPMQAGSDLEPATDNSSIHESRRLHRQVRAKNVANLLALDEMAWGLAPTAFQASRFPKVYRHRVSVIHDGVDTVLLRADRHVRLRLPNGVILDRHQPVITFVNRCLEPYRGFPQFMRSLPAVLSAYPDAQVLVVGNSQKVSYGLPPNDGRTWKDVMIEELADQLDLSRVHFLGIQDRAPFIRILQLSQCHVYLTVPFVLSWSLLEAMACGAPVVASDGPSVRDVIEHQKHGLLVNHNDPVSLSAAIIATLEDRDAAAIRARHARAKIEQDFDVQHCTSQRLALLELVASGIL